MEVYLITRRCPMRAYIERNGHHFNERLCDFAVSHLRNANGTDRHMDAKEVLGILAAADYKLDEDAVYDITYLSNLLYSDLYPNVITSEAGIVKAAYSYGNDPDGYEGQTFFRWVDDMRRKDIEIPWEEMS